MSEPYLGEIRMFGGNFAPIGWALCQGQLLPISENDALFTLIGTTYGGDGQSTFGLPDLQGRAPIHAGQGAGLSNYTPGEKGGAETVTLTVQQIPVHSHQLAASTGAGTTANPGANVLAAGPSGALYVDGVTPTDALAGSALTPVGGSQPHENLMPYVAITYIICLNGLFPSQS
jgi:microcystin-dependent protein